MNFLFIDNMRLLKCLIASLHQFSELRVSALETSVSPVVGLFLAYYYGFIQCYTFDELQSIAVIMLFNA